MGPHLLALFTLCLVVQSVPVSRNVKDYGARGDGVTDDTNAIITALTDGRSYNPSTMTPAIIRFPPGVYVVSRSLPLVYYTQMVGDQDDWPTIKFISTSAADVRILDAEGPWYNDAPQNNFFHQVRNFVIDMTQCTKCTGVHWQVAQATSLSNMVFRMCPNCQGVWMENGSGGFISDLVFEGGLFGLWVGNQQFTSRNISISGAGTAVYLNWDWGWTFQGLQVQNCGIGIDLGGGTGSVTLIDSTFNNVSIGVRTGFVTKSSDSHVQGPIPGVNTVVLDNLHVTGNSVNVVVQNSGNNVLVLSGSQTVTSWAQGHIWQNGQNNVTILNMKDVAPQRPQILAPNGMYFQRPRPQYASMVDVSTLGVVGDGTTDVTKALQAAIAANAGKNALFFPHGIYVITDTVVLAPGSWWVGEVWSALAAAGSNFQDAENPKPLLQVGNAGDIGSVELSDFLLTTVGPQPGVKLIEWNIHEPAGQPAACGMWDVHFRIGGATGTNINPGRCPADGGAGSPASACTGTWALMHVTPTGSVYMENVWGWTADHDIDQHSQMNVYNARGFLSESRGPVWMYGTAMEHSLYYQYNFYNSQNVMMGMIQTETPYFQPSKSTPFNPTDSRDPTFCTNDIRCNMAYALQIKNSNNIFLYGAGLYSFFNVWNQDCLRTAGGPTCQLEIVSVENSQQVYMYALNTYGSVYMLTAKEQSYAKASDNTNTFCSTSAVNLNLF